MASPLPGVSRAVFWRPMVPMVVLFLLIGPSLACAVTTHITQPPAGLSEADGAVPAGDRLLRPATGEPVDA